MKDVLRHWEITMQKNERNDGSLILLDPPKRKGKQPKPRAKNPGTSNASVAGLPGGRDPGGFSYPGGSGPGRIFANLTLTHSQVFHSAGLAGGRMGERSGGAGVGVELRARVIEGALLRVGGGPTHIHGNMVS